MARLRTEVLRLARQLGLSADKQMELYSLALQMWEAPVEEVERRVRELFAAAGIVAPNEDDSLRSAECRGEQAEGPGQVALDRTEAAARLAERAPERRRDSRVKSGGQRRPAVARPLPQGWWGPNWDPPLAKYHRIGPRRRVSSPRQAA